MRPTDRLRHTLPPKLKERGQQLFDQGRVFLKPSAGGAVEASVLGTRFYETSAVPRANSFDFSCTCPYYAGGSGFCKHLWATLLAAEEDGPPSPSPYPAGAAAPRRAEEWELRLGQLATAQLPKGRTWPEGRRVVYVIDLETARLTDSLFLDVCQQTRGSDGEWSPRRALSLSSELLSQLPDAADREILAMVLGVSTDRFASGYYYSRSIPGSQIGIPQELWTAILPDIARTGRGSMVVSRNHPPVALASGSGEAWELWLTARRHGPDYLINGVLRRGEQQMALEEPLLLAGGIVITRQGAVERFEDFGAPAWVASVRRGGPVFVPVARAGEALDRLLNLPALPRLDLPEELSFEEVPHRPLPQLRITRPPVERRHHRPKLRAEISFRYGDRVIPATSTVRGAYQSKARRLLLRDQETEARFIDQARGHGLHPVASSDQFTLAESVLPGLVRSLTELGWVVEAEGSVYRIPGQASVSVTSGIDWLDLRGTVEFGDQSASLPELLAAVRRGEKFVRLGDGSRGLLPEQWLDRYRRLAALGSPDGEAVRFQPSQLTLIDALLSARPEVTFDDTFRRARQRLLDFDRIVPLAEPETFRGELRPYQQDGLGWFRFLREFGFGGCLADDMGLGKTVQVLALLEERRSSGASQGLPTLVVVPASLVFNWLDEARRFAPQLRVLDHTGPGREPDFAGVDAVFTTYGTLRRDIARLAETQFDYCVLDEAQAIKNRNTASAKAAKLIRARHRLCLTGTPVENHLGELWSLIDFLNPGMLGSVPGFAVGAGRSESDPENASALGKALRPFILRRTKQQVATDLPTKTEQTVYCELPAGQRKHYEQLRSHYRRDLLSRVDREGIARSKIYVLEALLRLRQAACHPGLIDPKRGRETSAKLDLLLSRLQEVAEEGSKAIVFSQFTKFLSILRDRLDPLGLRYEYLDGHTRDRQARVDAFQNDPGCPLFLISLKAGGLGLNLTAAEYVFLLDPWWNPAVEAQAVDRAHRIGQTRPVFAYRIIARDTVEEKVLQLQESKRALADAIVTADNSLIRRIGREDLELLLS